MILQILFLQGHIYTYIKGQNPKYEAPSFYSSPENFWKILEFCRKSFITRVISSAKIYADWWGEGWKCPPPCEGFLLLLYVSPLKSPSGTGEFCSYHSYKNGVENCFNYADVILACSLGSHSPGWYLWPEFVHINSIAPSLLWWHRFYQEIPFVGFDFTGLAEWNREDTKKSTIGCKTKSFIFFNWNYIYSHNQP